MFGTNWTSACEIFRDLSVAQGDVPVRVEGTLCAGDKPPALNLKEETEEEYFLCSGGDAVDEGPDLGLIQEMLNMVRENNLSDEDESPQEAIVITKPNPTPPADIPAPEQPQIATEKKPKKQRRRNIALESFIGIDVTPKTNIKLLKPDDLIAKSKIVEPDPGTVKASIDKVKGWLRSNEMSTRKPAVCLEPPTNMFRKKNKVTSPIESPKDNLSIKTNSNKSPNQSQSKEFVPSSYAMEYCNKLKERAKLKENVVDDIWTKAEKQMKMLDQKRIAEAGLKDLTNPETDFSPTTDIAATKDIATTTDIAATTDIATTTDIASTNDISATIPESEESTTTTPHEQRSKSPRDPLEKLELPGHRHLLTDDCIVCQAFTEFGYVGFSEDM